MSIVSSDLGYWVSPVDVLVGQILKVDLDRMIMDVELAQFPSRVMSVPIRPLYISMYSNSCIFVVPRKGDRVLLQFRQGEYEHVGYYNPLTREEVGGLRTRWSLMRQSEGVDAGLRVPPLSEGDVGIFVRGESDESVDLVLSTAGLYMLSVGAATLLVDGKDLSNRVLCEAYEVVNSFGYGVKFGTPMVGGGEQVKQYVVGDFSYEIIGSNEEFRLGFIPKDKFMGPLPELSEEGEPVRLALKLKASQTELLVDVKGNIWLKSPFGNVLFKFASMKLDSNYVEVAAFKGLFDIDEVQVKSKDVKVTIEESDFKMDDVNFVIKNLLGKITDGELTFGDLILMITNLTATLSKLDLVINSLSLKLGSGNVQADSIQVSSSDIRLGTGMLDRLVKASILPLLQSHTHGCPDGGQTTSSPELINVASKGNYYTSSLKGA